MALHRINKRQCHVLGKHVLAEHRGHSHNAVIVRPAAAEEVVRLGEVGVNSRSEVIVVDRRETLQSVDTQTDGILTHLHGVRAAPGVRHRRDAVMGVDEIDRLLKGVELERFGTRVHGRVGFHNGVVLPRKRSKESW